MAVLTTLCLLDNNIGAEGAKAIAEALKVNAVLTELRLVLTKIGDEGAMAIAEALKVNAVLTTLNLGYNSIGVEGAMAIAEALKVNTVLTELGLQSNDSVPTMMQENSLALQSNHLGDAGKTAVQDAVKGRSGFQLYLFR